MSHVDVKNLKPSSFEEEYYDQYEYYNLTDKYTGERTLLNLDRNQLLCSLTLSCSQKARPGKAGARRRPVTTPTDTTRPDMSARSWRSCRTARRKPKSDSEVRSWFSELV